MNAYRSISELSRPDQGGNLLIPSEGKGLQILKVVGRDTDNEGAGRLNSQANMKAPSGRNERRLDGCAD